MLSSLHIRNYILIDSLDVEFPEGLIVITGATGAGKSILTGALGLLCGAKADASAIGPGGEHCVVEGHFLFKDERFEALCAANDVDYNGGDLLLRRVVSSSGRSRSFINDEPVCVGVLENISAALLDIHSQHDTMGLTDKRFQLSVLDLYASNSELLRKSAKLWTELALSDASIKELSDKLERARRENDYNSALYEQLAKASVKPGELAELEAEQYKLSNSGQIKELLSSCMEMFDSDSHQRDLCVNPALVQIERKLRKLSEYIPSAEELSSRLGNARIELKDIYEQLEKENESLSCDPERLSCLDERIALVRDLLKRHSCQTEEELGDRMEELRKMTVGLEDMAQELEALRLSREEISSQLKETAKELHTRRVRCAGKFSEAVLGNLKFMELENAVFQVNLNQTAPSPSGSDEVSFLFSSTGTSPVPVAKCASGGELSRIMLSLKQFMSGFMNLPTIVFDEIDTGVSGSAADRMGTVICRMGDSSQVFAITHLPQVAAKGKAHFLVEKTSGNQRTESRLREISGRERVMEVARMLSGESTTPQAVANAESLLGLQS